MQLFTVSNNEIQNELINYFAMHFDADPTTIYPGTDVKKRFRYKDPAWGELADELSLLPWMKQLGVVLIDSDMTGVATIAELAVLIKGHIRHVVAATMQMDIKPLSDLMSKSVSEAAAFRRKASKKAKKAKKKAKNG